MKCSIEGCLNIVIAKNLCKMHYMRIRRNGTSNKNSETRRQESFSDDNFGYIKLTQNKIAIVDKEDFERVNKYSWSSIKGSNTYYASTRSGKTSLLMHKLILSISDKQIDHVDGNGLNNTKENLRFATFSENGMNKKKLKNTTSIYKGVYWKNKNSIWIARIKLNQKDIYIGSFKNEKEAAKAYDKKAEELFGEFALTNKKLKLI